MCFSLCIPSSLSNFNVWVLKEHLDQNVYLEELYDIYILENCLDVLQMFPI